MRLPGLEADLAFAVLTHQHMQAACLQQEEEEEEVEEEEPKRPLSLSHSRHNREPLCLFRMLRKGMVLPEA